MRARRNEPRQRLGFALSFVPMSPATPPDLAALLVAAHRDGTGLPFSPDFEPAAPGAAFAVQAAVATALDESIAGWKVGFSPQKLPVAGPLYASLVGSSGATLTLPRHTPLIVEAEIGFRLAGDLPPRRDEPYTREEILDAVAEVLIGFELIASRLGDPAKVPFTAFLADNLGNAGYIAGDAIRAFGDLDLAALRCMLDVDGAIVHDRPGGHPQDDPVLPLLAWANAQQDGLGGLRAGQIVTTGSLALRRFTAPAEVSARIEGIGEVSARLVAVQ